jgi:hypothetical protein
MAELGVWPVHVVGSRAQLRTLHLGSGNALLIVDGMGIEPTVRDLCRGPRLGFVQRARDIYWANFLERARIKSEEQASHITGARKQASASTISLWK